jgi:hypothetical protein
MKMFTRLFLVALIAVFAVSTMSAAPRARPAKTAPQFTFEEKYRDTPPDFCGPIAGDRACYIDTGYYIQCTAKGSAGQKCAISVEINGVKTCGWVDRDASCQCVAGKASGYCQWYR